MKHMLGNVAFAVIVGWITELCVAWSCAVGKVPHDMATAVSSLALIMTIVLVIVIREPIN